MRDRKYNIVLYTVIREKRGEEKRGQEFTLATYTNPHTILPVHRTHITHPFHNVNSSTQRKENLLLHSQLTTQETKWHRTRPRATQPGERIIEQTQDKENHSTLQSIKEVLKLFKPFYFLKP